MPDSKLFRIISIILFLSVLSCSKTTTKNIDVSNIEVEVDVIRFDQKFYTTPPNGLDDLKSEYPYLFPESNPDSIWLNKMKDKDEQDLFSETQKIYSDFTRESDQLKSLFKHIKYYSSNFKEPKVITILNNVDYNNNVVLADSLLFISLDIFLGKDHYVYEDFPNYIKNNYTSSHMVVAVAEKFTEQMIPPNSNKSFISRIVQEGKKLVLLQAFLPNVDSAELIGYSKEEFLWAENSEVEIWKYFIQNSMLYSTDSQLKARFIENAPFSKFFLEIDKESPGRIGVWFGWQIVEAYMNNNNVTLQKLMLKDNEDIFKQSKYKPRKK